MNLQKKLIQLSEYRCSFKYVDSYFLISVIYPEAWSIIPSEDKSIEIAEENGTTFYAAPIETDIEVAFNLIDDTISYNLDIEKKMALLKYNIGKLQELFAEKDLDELETIEFTFKQKSTKQTVQKMQKKRSGRKVSAKKKEETLTQDDYVEESSKLESRTNEKDLTNVLIMKSDENSSTNNRYLEEVER